MKQSLAVGCLVVRMVTVGSPGPSSEMASEGTVGGTAPSPGEDFELCHV